jgi:hypothetical protein
MSGVLGVIGIRTRVDTHVDIKLGAGVTNAEVDLLTCPATAHWNRLKRTEVVFLGPGDHFIRVSGDVIVDAAAGTDPVTFTLHEVAAMFIRWDGVGSDGSGALSERDKGAFHDVLAVLSRTTGKDPWPQPPPGSVTQPLLVSDPAHAWYHAQLKTLPARNR